ncbi:MAG: hypothetical protein ACRD43_02420 [Pyrinomonadaceae bacterium]
MSNTISDTAAALIDEAKRYGGYRRCGHCDEPNHYQALSPYGEIVVCAKCERDLKAEVLRKSQPNLFGDDQIGLLPEVSS